MMRRRYSRFTARLTVAGDMPKDLATPRWLAPLPTSSITAASCSSDNRRGAPSFLPSAFAFSEWWLNSIRERSVPGQAKARVKGVSLVGRQA